MEQVAIQVGIDNYYMIASTLNEYTQKYHLHSWQVVGNQLIMVLTEKENNQDTYPLRGTDDAQLR